LKIATCLARFAAIVTCAFAHVTVAQVDTAETPSPEQIKKGSATYSQNCSPCHGPRMLDPQGAFDLRIFPRDEKSRFLTSVSKGKNQMPPWGGLLSADDIEALWAYVIAGEK
jgi:mono/diheme cytochrome c family protein